MKMSKNIVLVIFLASVVDLGRCSSCPLRRCDGNTYKLGSLDYVACVQELKQTEQCIQSAQNQSDICTKCFDHEYNKYTQPDFIADKTAKFCYNKQCKRDELLMCSMQHMQSMMNVFLFQDTSNIDGVVSCVEAWKPELDRKTCFKGIAQTKLASCEDPVVLFKQMLQEIKDGCDVLLPLVECRKHLAPLAPLMFGPRSPGNTASLTSALETTITCVLSSFKKYPCKIIASQLAAEKDDILKQATKLLGESQVNNYAKQCQGGPSSQLFSFLFRK